MSDTSKPTLDEIIHNFLTAQSSVISFSWETNEPLKQQLTQLIADITMFIRPEDLTASQQQLVRVIRQRAKERGITL